MGRGMFILLFTFISGNISMQDSPFPQLFVCPVIFYPAPAAIGEFGGIAINNCHHWNQKEMALKTCSISYRSLPAISIPELVL